MRLQLRILEVRIQAAGGDQAAVVEVIVGLHFLLMRLLVEGSRLAALTDLFVLRLGNAPDDKRLRETGNIDSGLNFLAGKRVDEVNKMAELGTQIAHVDGGVPNMKVCMPALTAQYIGQLFYFFELACGISGSMLGVNPFDQPGVEAYKNNMFALLDKPGYEEASKAIKAKI